jgi:hypothetical protein
MPSRGGIQGSRVKSAAAATCMKPKTTNITPGAAGTAADGADLARSLAGNATQSANDCFREN